MNPGPPGPEPGALAKLRYIPKYFYMLKNVRSKLRDAKAFKAEAKCRKQGLATYIPKYFYCCKEAIIDEGIREVNTKRIQDEENL